MTALPCLFLLGALSLSGLVQAQTSLQALKDVALGLGDKLTCTSWDCNCTFRKDRGCCCGANEMFANEDAMFERMKHLYEGISVLEKQVQELAAERKIAFQARMNVSIATGTLVPCFGPFNTDVPIPFGTVLVNDGNGFNPALGTFTAPRSGAYVFSFTVASMVEDTGLLYHKVDLVLEGEPKAAVWENNREDFQDSATQYVILQLNKGNQIYLRLVSGRKICTTLDSTIFSGFMLYPN